MLPFIGLSLNCLEAAAGREMQIDALRQPLVLYTQQRDSASDPSRLDQRHAQQICRTFFVTNGFDVVRLEVVVALLSSATAILV